MISVLLWGLAALIALPVLALAIPIHLAFRLAEDGAEVEVRLFSGRLPPVWRGRPGGGAATPKTEPEPEPERKRRRRVPSPFMRRLIPLAIRALPGLIADTIRGIHLDRLAARGRFGLGDPAETGALYGRLCPLLYAPLPGPLDIDIAPDFDLTGFDGEAELALHAVPLRLAWPSLRTGAQLAWEAAW